MTAPQLWIPPRPESPLYGLDGPLQDLFDACYADPPLFVAEVLRKKPRRWQSEVLDEVRVRRSRGEQHTQIHVRAAHFAGKGWLTGALVLWWMATRPGARTLTTAPTWRGVEELLWTEIRKLYAESLLFDLRLGRMLDTKWDMGKGWFAVGASSDQPANLEGQHSMIAACRAVDEAKAVPDPIFTATEGLLASPESLDIWISTPAARTGAFYRRDIGAGPELIRKVVTIDDLIADDVPGALRWKQNALIEYGGEHTFEYQSRANAQYIDDSEGALIPFSWIERAMLTDAERTAQKLPIWHIVTRPTLGYDVAGSVDGDENAVAPVSGPDSERRYECGTISHWHQHDTMVSKDQVVEACRASQAKMIRVDVQGLGKGVGDAISRERGERGLPFYVEEYRSADPADDPERFLNKKAENCWNIRLLLERDALRLPKQPKLREQIAAMKYEVRNGIIRVVDPADSPDWWDALVMAVGGVYYSVGPEAIGGGGMDTSWGAMPEHLAWTSPRE
jgi:hypothetical protein